MSWGAIDFTNGLFDFAGMEPEKCSQVEYVAIKEADIKVDCDFEDHVDNIFMRLSLE